MQVVRVVCTERMTAVTFKGVPIAVSYYGKLAQQINEACACRYCMLNLWRWPIGACCIAGRPSSGSGVGVIGACSATV